MVMEMFLILSRFPGVLQGTFRFLISGPAWSAKVEVLVPFDIQGGGSDRAGFERSYR
jgi:hypothetical protein